MTIIIQAVEAGGRSWLRKFPSFEFAGKKSPDLVFSNVDRYGGHWLKIVDNGINGGESTVSEGYTILDRQYW